MSDITSRVVTISQLYSQGRFQIPWHQRNYSWDRAQVEELLIDIDDAAAEKRICYFLGSLLLVRKPKDLWEINDGQQRMITLSLIASWLARNAYSGKNASKAKLRRLSELMFSNYKPSIGADDFFDKLKPRIITPDEYRPSYEMLLREGGIGHAGHLKTAWETIAEHFGKRKHSAARFADYLLDKLEVSCIYIPNNVNPNSIFESINCRGRKLDDFDLIRNYLYSFFNNRNAEKEAVHQKLEQLTVRLGNKKRIAEYLDCFFQCKYGYLQQNFFYRNVKRAIEAAERTGSPKQTREKIYSLISELTEHKNLSLFAGMKRPRNDESMAFLSEFLTKNKAPRPLTSLLGEMKDYKVTYPISFALLTLLMRCFPNRNKDLATVMHVNRQISVFNAFLMRSTFAVTTLSPSLYAEQFSQLACGIYSTKNPSKLDIARDLKDCHNAEVIMNSNRFGGIMKDISINSLAKARTLLEGIYACDHVPNGGVQVEHILPRSEKSWAQWPGFPKDEAPLYVNRIGNLALLRSDEARTGTSLPITFREKLGAYRASSYKLTQAIAGYGKKWTPKLVQKRQSDLVKLALKTWHL